jgi:hypothetical protein
MLTLTVTPGFKGQTWVRLKCVPGSSHTYDDSWYKNECHIFIISYEDNDLATIVD